VCVLFDLNYRKAVKITEELAAQATKYLQTSVDQEKQGN